MKKLIMALMLTTLSTAFAKSHIVDVDPAEKSGEDHMVMWSNGKVTFTKKLPHFKKAKQLFPEVAPMMSYEPTDVGTEEAALKLLKSMRKPNLIQWNIQCYNLAHVRAYEMMKYHGVNSQKMFLFFTKSYIRKYRFKWWFHVTPVVQVKNEQRILDPEWSKTPLPVKTWTDKYIKTKSSCPVITKYSSYEQNQETSDCYVYPAPMYYWQPLHLIELEESRQEMGSFNMSQVNTAYARDF
ncbi:MAG: protein-glutamine glutaminase family protein [Bdellovibrionota bacterium]